MGGMTQDAPWLCASDRLHRKYLPIPCAQLALQAALDEVWPGEFEVSSAGDGGQRCPCTWRVSVR